VPPPLCFRLGGEGGDGRRNFDERVEGMKQHGNFAVMQQHKATAAKDDASIQAICCSSQ